MKRSELEVNVQGYQPSPINTIPRLKCLASESTLNSMRVLGKRLYLKDHSYVEQYFEDRLDCVRELKTELLLSFYPKNLEALTISLAYIPTASDFLQNIPADIRWLSLHISPEVVDRRNMN